MSSSGRYGGFSFGISFVGARLFALSRLDVYSVLLSGLFLLFSVLFAFLSLEGDFVVSVSSLFIDPLDLFTQYVFKNLPLR
ncbi:MAG: hypothetical protein ACFFB5_12650 [Promethearchaeota archaeon]